MSLDSADAPGPSWSPRSRIRDKWCVLCACTREQSQESEQVVRERRTARNRGTIAQLSTTSTMKMASLTTAKTCGPTQ
eukprot:5812307-Prymnesium_polylepis.1